MHEHFSSWFRTASAQADRDPELLAKRWSGVEAVSNSIKLDDVDELVKKSFGFESSDDFNETFLNLLVESDPAFPTQENDQLLSILAGSAIANVIEEEGEYAEYASMAVVSCHFDGRRECKTTGLPDISRIFLKRQSSQRFTSNHPVTFKAFPFGKRSTEALTALETTPEIVASIAKSLSSLSAKTSQIANWAKSATNQTKIQQEELNVLWWLLGECSRDMSVHFSDIGVPGCYFVIAKELTDLVTLLPGPVSASAFLKKAIGIAGDGGKKDVTILKAVNETSVEWKSSLLDAFPFEPSPEISPCLYGALQSMSSKTPTSWATGFKQSSRVDSKGKLYAYELCQQLFNELMTFRYYSELTGADE